MFLFNEIEINAQNMYRICLGVAKFFLSTERVVVVEKS